MIEQAHHSDNVEYPSHAASAEELVRGLLSAAGREGRKSALSLEQLTGDHHVLFDTQVDGVRCLLLKLQPRAQVPAIVLSPREQQIVKMIASGHQNKTIAADLAISVWTVSTHVRRIFAKYGVTSRAAMVSRAIEEGARRT